MRQLITSTFALLLPALLISLTGCGGADPTFDNQAACENFVNSYNSLSCVDDVIQFDAATYCDAYAQQTTVDCSAIFNCYAENMACEEVPGTGIETINNFSEGCPTECV
jgi:hypothetical protein